jgi:dihydrofolate reductase
MEEIMLWLRGCPLQPSSLRGEKVGKICPALNPESIVLAIPLALSYTYKRSFSMAHLIYSAISSLDGYIEDRQGQFDWAAPDEEVHSFINDLERTVGTYLLGRRMYETMTVWETDPNLAAESPLLRDYAEMWQAANKIVYSRTLAAVSTRQTQLVRAFDPEAIRQLKASAARDISIGGPELAAHAFRAGLVDECQLFLTPVIVGGGKPSLPDDVRLDLELLEEHRFGSGVVFLRYRTRQGSTA